MTIEDIKSIPRPALIPSDIAPLFGCSPFSINKQAQKNPVMLGFPVSVIGTRVYIPKDGFIVWWMGDTPRAKEATLCA